MSTMPSMRVTRNTPARVGDQQPEVRYELWYLVKKKERKRDR